MKPWRKTAAAVLAAAVLCGAAPYTGGAFLPVITANAEDDGAAEPKLVVSGGEYGIGDTIYFGGDDVYVIMNDTSTSANNWRGVTRILDGIEYRSDFHQYMVGTTGIWITSDELPFLPTGIKVLGSGTESDPYTFTLIESLEDGLYTQYAEQDGKYYTRFAFVTPKSEFAGKSQVKFTVDYDGTDYTYETSYYYTGMTANMINYKPASEDSVMFIVTVESSENIGEELTCELNFD